MMIKRKPRFCFFCENKTSPDYKNIEALNQFVSSRGKIIGRSKTNVCRRHQKRLTKAIKRARHLALLPFVSKIK